MAETIIGITGYTGSVKARVDEQKIYAQGRAICPRLVIPVMVELKPGQQRDGDVIPIKLIDVRGVLLVAGERIADVKTPEFQQICSYTQGYEGQLNLEAYLDFHRIKHIETVRLTASSDADLIIILKDSEKSFLDRMTDFIPPSFPLPLEVFPYTSEEVGEGNLFLKRALKEGVVLWRRPESVTQGFSLEKSTLKG